ncbi:hypothetical protein DL769_003130 [Monosporascus sp. CRB-8-3]|nr:hypothetical protein DL769_003130 [Monosporascus sp. CRB-8-3]
MVQKAIFESSSSFAKLFLLDCCYAGLTIKKAKARLQKKKAKPKAKAKQTSGNSGLAMDWIYAAYSIYASNSGLPFTKEVIEPLADLGGRPFTAASLFPSLKEDGGGTYGSGQDGSAYYED